MKKIHTFAIHKMCYHRAIENMRLSFLLESTACAALSIKKGGKPSVCLNSLSVNGEEYPKKLKCVSILADDNLESRKNCVNTHRRLAR